MPWFRAAERKQEAVDRLTALSGVPQYKLGNGGKEYAQTFLDIARRFAPHLLDQKRTKHEWAATLGSRI
ncbi:hypothetical protein GCM10025868_27270 [Angustibacter aerolatus]|uniref:Uncharacterized protein n=1 Tax=Angustibacter aerolatus TaxID=1162965 RepID=A0ABQ6JGV7_9ACTN|nr:hypothetical protein GCM10025868_27270 [Angustibacter aerolatus]